MSYITGLRPLGNKKRLTHTSNEDSYDVRLLLFRDRASAEKYYQLFINHAKKNRPPFLIEVMVIYIPKSIFDEKYALAIPNENADKRLGYGDWARDAMRSCNDTLRIHNSTDHKYKALHDYVDAVYKWDIIVPQDFSEASSEGKELLCDDPNEEYAPLKVLEK